MPSYNVSVQQRSNKNKCKHLPRRGVTNKYPHIGDATVKQRTIFARTISEHRQKVKKKKENKKEVQKLQNLSKQHKHLKRETGGASKLPSTNCIKC